jgi:hypothetical protein
MRREESWPAKQLQDDDGDGGYQRRKKSKISGGCPPPMTEVPTAGGTELTKALAFAEEERWEKKCYENGWM